MADSFEYVTKDISEKKVSSNDFNKWWLQPEEQIAQAVFASVQQIVNTQYRFWKHNFIFAQLYENIDTLLTVTSSPLFAQYFDLTPVNQVYSSKLTYNVVKSCVDSVTAKIAKNKPRVKFITNGGDFKLGKRAKNLTKYMDGIFYETDYYKRSGEAFRDACIFGTGALKIYTDKKSNKIKIDRVLVPVEIVIDWADARYGKPKVLHQRKVVDRDTLLEIYRDTPEKVAKIASAATLPNPMNLTQDQVIVIESWRLPSSSGATDGKHTVCVDNCTLESEEYKKDFFPFVFYRWTNRVQGFYGYGLTEELSFIQLAINKAHKMIQAMQEINCVPRWFVTAGSLIKKHAFYDAGIQEVKEGFSPPVANAGPTDTLQYLNSYLETLNNKAYQISGVSQLSASSQKPAGVNSGVALREYQDINTERFAMQGEEYEQNALKAAEIVIDLSRDMYKEKNSLTVKTKSASKKFIETIDWKDCGLEDNLFSMECFPVSKLPTTPEGRLAFITELAQAGYIQRAQVIELMEMPDIENFYSLSNASFDLVMKHMEMITENNEVALPDPAMDLQLTSQLAQAYYLKSVVDNLPEENLQAMRDYIANCKLLMDQANPAPPPTQPAPQMPPQNPQAVPAPPPVSSLLPQ